jgi:hypothetical protein
MATENPEAAVPKRRVDEVHTDGFLAQPHLPLGGRTGLLFLDLQPEGGPY